MIKTKSLLILISTLLFSNYYLSSFTQEITITTYYPSPVGIYKELRAKRMAIGDNFYDPSKHCWWDDSCASKDIDSLADLVVEGRVGIGTVDPGAELDVSGRIWQTNTGKSVFLGEKAGANDDLDDNKNVFVGYEVGYSNTTGEVNTFVGYHAGYSNISASGNTFVGAVAGVNNSYGENNTFIGCNAGTANVSGDQNTFVGAKAGRNSTGSSNTFVGYEAGYGYSGVFSGSANTFIGYQAGYSITTGGSNVFIGSQAGRENTRGQYNVFIGNLAGSKNTAGERNVYIGLQAGYENTTGNDNVFIGYTAGQNNTDGGGNIFIGLAAGYEHETGNDNIFIGYRAGYNNKNGRGNIFIGYGAGENETGSDKLYIDNSNTSTPLIYGDFANDELTINGDLHVSGTVYASIYEEYGDIAENFLVREEVEEGDVVVVDLSSKEGLTKSKKPYSSLVIGVISKNPALIIGGKKGENYKPVALKGVVLTKVIGPIKRGDILVTSHKEGYAMKADLKKIFSPTQIVGIALDELKEKEGKIRVFVR